MASIELAAATDARFVREIFTGVYASDFGLWNTDVGAAARHRRALDAQDVRLLMNIVPEGARYLADRDVADIARSTVFNAKPDALCVSGLTAGAETDTQVLYRVKQAVGDTPVFVNTGVNPANVREQLAIADGAVVGTYFKVDGVFENPSRPRAHGSADEGRGGPPPDALTPCSSVSTSAPPRPRRCSSTATAACCAGASAPNLLRVPQPGLGGARRRNRLVGQLLHRRGGGVRAE